MQNVVKVTRRGQTTIPAEIRHELGIKEGDQLVVQTVSEGILFKRIPKLEDMAGVDAQYGKVEEIKKHVDKLREEC